ncbi:MAG TPA: hypothetical protein VIL04_11450 [Solirubrobacterales bacterium]
MGKKLGLVVAALVGALLFSGCYALREVSWTVDNVKPGKATKAKLSFMSDPDFPERPIVFIALAVQGSSGIKIQTPKWDTTKVLGNKPKQMVSEPGLADAVRDLDSFCSDLLPEEGSQVLVWRTKGPQRSAGRRFVEAQIPVKVGRRAPGGGMLGVVVSGAWFDDGDRVPDPTGLGDGYECTGVSTTGFGVRGPLEEKPLRTLDLRALLP